MVATTLHIHYFKDFFFSFLQAFFLFKLCSCTTTHSLVSRKLRAAFHRPHKKSTNRPNLAGKIIQHFKVLLVRGLLPLHARLHVQLRVLQVGQVLVRVRRARDPGVHQALGGRGALGGVNHDHHLDQVLGILADLFPHRPVLCKNKRNTKKSQKEK